MNYYGDCPRCPLCPYTAQYNVQQLAWHLSISHLMKNSANILARTMKISQIGYQEVFEVLKDVGKLNERFLDSANYSREKDLENQDLELKIKSLELKNQELSKVIAGSEIKKIHRLCQTDPVYFKLNKIQTEVCQDVEIEPKQADAEKKMVREILDSQNNDTEAQVKTHMKESSNYDGDLGEEKASLLMNLRDDLKAVKDRNIRKDLEIQHLKLLALEHESHVKSLVSEKKKQNSHLKAINFQLVKEKECEQKISAQLIESQKTVHEKEIQDLNLKLQNQINRSQGLKSREKSLLEEVESLRAEVWMKNDLIQSLSHQENTQVKISDQVVNEKSKLSNIADLKSALESLDGKDIEINELNDKIETLDAELKKLDRNMKELKNHFFRKSKEHLDIKHRFENFKELSNYNITEKDKMIACLRSDHEITQADLEIFKNDLESNKADLRSTEAELESIKADAELAVEESEKCTEKIMTYEKIIAEMKKKFGQYQEIVCLMKDSLAGLAAMHEDFSNKLVEAVKNTAHAGQVVMRDVKKQVKELEEEIAMFDDNSVLVDKMVLNNNYVKKEPDDACEEGRLSKTSDLVAHDLSLEFNAGGSGQATSSSEDRSGRSITWSRKKRKFTE